MKDSFILYTSQYHAISRLTLEQKGRLLDCIFRYAMGERVEIEDDRELAMAFAFIEERMTFNADKYEQIIEKRRAAGRKGANKTNLIRWGYDNSAKSANADDCQQNRQMSAKSADSVSDSDSDSVSDSVSTTNVADVNNNNNCNAYALTSSADDKVDASDKKNVVPDNKDNAKNDFDYKEFVAYFNSTLDQNDCKIPRVRTLDERRKNKVHARLQQYGKDALYEVVQKAAKSLFLNGGGNKGFRASFDWLFGPDNFKKVLEGNYDNREQVGMETGRIYRGSNTGKYDNMELWE